MSINGGAGDAKGVGISMLLLLEVVLAGLFPIQVSILLFAILGSISPE